MPSKEAHVATRFKRWKTRICVMSGAAIVLAACLWARQFWGPESAMAQTPSGGQRAQAPPPAARTAVPPTQTRPRVPVDNQRQLSVMASVNQQPISRQDLANACLMRYGKDVLESVVNKKLILQACQQRGFTITEQDVQNEINRMATKFGLSADRWLKLLEEERGIKPAEYAREIIWPTLALRRLAVDKIQVSEQELQTAFETEYGAKVKVRLIAMRKRQDAEQVRAKALANPEEFGNLAKQYSTDAASAAARGLIPPIRRHIGDKNLERIAFSLKEGQISPVIPADDQFIILTCEKHLPPTYIADKFRQDARSRLSDRIRDQKLREADATLFK